MTDNLSLDFDFDFNTKSKPIIKEPKNATSEKVQIKSESKSGVRVHTERGNKIYTKRRFFSEKALLETIDWHFNDGEIHCVITGGDVDSLTFLKHVLRQQKLHYCLVSSWCFGIEDTLEIKTWVEKKLIDRIDFYVGEIARASYAKCTEDLIDISAMTNGRCAVFRNHSKVILCYGDKFTCAILSSANVNTNPRTENTTIICEKEVADFYKSYFDDIKPFNGNPDNWVAWKG